MRDFRDFARGRTPVLSLSTLPVHSTALGQDLKDEKLAA